MRYFLFIGLYIFSSHLIAQKGNHGLLTKFSYSAHIPVGDLADRFGLHYSPGLQLDYRISKKLTVGPEFNFQFGNKVKENVLFQLQDSQGAVIGRDGTRADVFLRQRGTYLGLNLGMLSQLGDPQSGNFMHAQLSVGHWQHKIRIIDESNTADQIRGEYIKLYDRLSNGLAFKQIIGLTHLSTHNATNYFVQLELMQGFIKNRRDWDAVLQSKDEDSRFDFSIGIRIGWILPLFEGSSKIKGQDIYY